LLESMESIWINYNRFEGPIPSEIGLLSNLEYLNLQGNGFTGTLPSAITSLLPNLGELFYRCHYLPLIPPYPNNAFL
jgi:Leucine-rich repeat (LRR) protein